MANDVIAPDRDERINVHLTYGVDTGELPVNEVLAAGKGSRRVSGSYQDREVELLNGRSRREDLDLETHGFIFVDQKTSVPDFYDKDAIASIYYPEMERLILEATGGKRVHIFDHTLRHSDEATRGQRLVREPAISVHNDYTEWSGPQRLRDVLPDEAEDLLKGRFAIVQVWRSINTPIETTPLAMCDARSLSPADLIVTERRSPGRIGQTYRIAYNPAQEWYWFPRMTRDEALVFKVYDSKTDGTVRWTAHTAFNNPTAPANAPPRESIEIRSFVFW
jgi:hypothetical protein